MEFWIYLKIIFAGLAVISLGLSGVIAWRVRGVWRWQKSLNAEIRAMEAQVGAMNSGRRMATKQVLSQCKQLRQSLDVSINRISDLGPYLRSIAKCYHPTAIHPELCLTLGQAIRATSEMVNRLERVIQHKGLQRFAWIRVRHIHDALRWYDRIYHHSILGWFFQHYKVIARMLRFRHWIFPDPFTLIAYYSNRLTILILTRTLLLDLYLFIGKLAIDAYDPSRIHHENKFDSDHLAETLTSLYDSESFNQWQGDTEVIEIRDRLVGIPKRIILPPTFSQWRDAIIQAVTLIAERNFSQSDAPLEEAALGPILIRLQSLLLSISDISHHSGVDRLFLLRLESIYNARAFAGNLAQWPYKGLFQKAWGGYRKMRWPLKIYRWFKRSSPGGIAMDVGWEAFRKIFINLMARYTFDRICKEAEGLYKSSRKDLK